MTPEYVVRAIKTLSVLNSELKSVSGEIDVLNIKRGKCIKDIEAQKRILKEQLETSGKSSLLVQIDENLWEVGPGENDMVVERKTPDIRST